MVVVFVLRKLHSECPRYAKKFCELTEINLINIPLISLSLSPHAAFAFFSSPKFFVLLHLTFAN